MAKISITTHLHADSEPTDGKPFVLEGKIYKNAKTGRITVVSSTMNDAFLLKSEEAYDQGLINANVIKALQSRNRYVLAEYSNNKGGPVKICYCSILKIIN